MEAKSTGPSSNPKVLGWASILLVLLGLGELLLVYFTTPNAETVRHAAGAGGIGRVATLSGFGSAIALCHAFSEAWGSTPGALQRQLRERWGGRHALDEGAAVEAAARRAR